MQDEKSDVQWNVSRDHCVMPIVVFNASVCSRNRVVVVVVVGLYWTVSFRVPKAWLEAAAPLLGSPSPPLAPALHLPRLLRCHQN
mmetsp:Transcript_55825/g.147580  ORF Transcript_55825/g.147580 Transcript_55825/m.147580 type:complete len:85 (-) Transcript_55825:560-814(-)